MQPVYDTHKTEKNRFSLRDSLYIVDYIVKTPQASSTIIGIAQDLTCTKNNESNNDFLRPSAASVINQESHAALTFINYVLCVIMLVLLTHSHANRGIHAYTMVKNVQILYNKYYLWNHLLVKGQLLVQSRFLHVGDLAANDLRDFRWRYGQSETGNVVT